MANESVTISACAINPVLHLSHLIKTALQRSCDQSAGFHEHYRGQFGLLVGLSLTAMLAKGDQKQACKKYLDAFLSYSDDFTRCFDEFDRVSVLVAEVVCSAMRPFQFLGSPRYFDDFIHAVISVIYPAGIELIEKKEKVHQLLQKLFETCK